MKGSKAGGGRLIAAVALLLALAAPASAATISRVAGGGAAGGSVATNAYVDANLVACFDDVRAVASTSLGIVQRILPDGTLQDEAGTTLRVQHSAPWTGRALTTSFSPYTFDVDPGGRYWIVGTRPVTGFRLYRVNGPDIEIVTEPGGGVDLVSPSGLAATSEHVWITDAGVGKLYRYSLACGGPRCQPDRTVAGLSVPRDVAVSSDGALVYVLESSGGRIKRVNPDGTTTLIAQGLGTPGGFDLADDGTLYVADTTNSRVLSVAPAGGVTVVAGTGQAQNGNAWVEVGPGEPATAQPITRPRDVAVCGSTLLVASSDDKRVYAVDLEDGTIATPTLPPATPTATRSPSPTQTPPATFTATRPPTQTPMPTRTATLAPTAIPTCADGETPSCQAPGVM